MFPPEEVLRERRPFDLGQALVWAVVLAIAAGAYQVWSHRSRPAAAPDAAEVAARLAPIGRVTRVGETPPVSPDLGQAPAGPATASPVPVSQEPGLASSPAQPAPEVEAADAARQTPVASGGAVTPVPAVTAPVQAKVTAPPADQRTDPRPSEPRPAATRQPAPYPLPPGYPAGYAPGYPPGYPQGYGAGYGGGQYAPGYGPYQPFPGGVPQPAAPAGQR